MKCSEAVIFCFVINPDKNLLVGNSVKSPLHESVADFLQILKTSHVQKCIPAVIDDVNNGHSGVLLYLLHESMHVPLFDVLETVFCNLLNYHLINPRCLQLLKGFIGLCVTFVKVLGVYLNTSTVQRFIFIKLVLVGDRAIDRWVSVTFGLFLCFLLLDQWLIISIAARGVLIIDVPGWALRDFVGFGTSSVTHNIK